MLSIDHKDIPEYKENLESTEETVFDYSVKLDVAQSFVYSGKGD